MKGGQKVVVEKHRLEGVYIVTGKEDALATKNLVPGESVYGEKRVAVEVILFSIQFIFRTNPKLNFKIK